MSTVAGAGATDTLPEVTFVVPAVNLYSDLQKTVRALLSEGQAHRLEICVVSRLGAAFAARAQAEFPSIRLLEVSADTPIPQMRARAFEAARAPVIAVIEDHVQVPPGWVSRVLQSVVVDGDVVAGPVRNVATSTLVDRAAFLCEYSHCLPPVPSGQSDWLPGNSVAYRADVLREHAHTVAAGGWENELHAAIAAAGRKLWFVSELEVGHDKHYSVGEYFSQRYLYARSYAGNRVRARGVLHKLVYASASALLPAMLLARISSRVWRRPEHRSTLVASLPLLVLFVLAWGAGECVGYLLGPGNALARVR